LIYCSKEQYEESLKDFDEAIRLEPDDPTGYDGRAGTYAAMGQIE
jgi:hypothetical protein